MTRSVLMFLGVAVLVGSLLACDAPADVEARTKSAARAWCSDMGLHCVGVSCVGRDTDMDGYVSCDLSVLNAREQTELVSVQCSWNGRDGCKRTMPSITAPATQ